MLTEDFTFQVRDDGVILNTDVVLPFVDITRVVGLDSTPYRATERQHEGQDGGFMDAEFEEGRHVILEGTVYAAEGGMEEFLDLLKEDFAPVRSPVSFFLRAPGRDERLLFVKPLGMRYAWDSKRRTGQADAQFLLFAEDPRIYTSALQSSVIDVNFATDIPGFSFDFGFDFTFGAPLVGNGQDVVAGGNRPSPPLLTINAVSSPCVNPRILNLTQSRSLVLNITLGAGDTLVLDPYRRTVTLNGVVNRRSALVVDQWFLLQVGTNFIGYRSGSDDDSTLTVTHRDAWR